MAENGKAGFLDDDIMKIIHETSFINQRYLNCYKDRQEYEKQMISLNKGLQDTQETVKLQITELAESKQLITDQQVTISKLVAIKNEAKRYKDDILAREKRIDDLEKEKFEYHNSHQLDQKTFEDELNKKVIDAKREYEEEVKNLYNQMNIMTSEGVCSARRSEKEKNQLIAEKDEMINRLVLEYEEKLQRAHALYMRVKDENRTNKNRLEILEQKLPRTNIVAPNVLRVNTPTFQPESSSNNSYKPQFIKSNQVPVDMGKKPPVKQLSSNPGPYKLIQKGSTINTNPGNYKALPVVITPSSSNLTEGKPLKRKLFSRALDDFQDVI